MIFSTTISRLGRNVISFEGVSGGDLSRLSGRDLVPWLCCYIQIHEGISVIVTSSPRAKSRHFQPVSRDRSHGLSGLEEFTVLSIYTLSGKLH